MSEGRRLYAVQKMSEGVRCSVTVGVRRSKNDRKRGRGIRSTQKMSEKNGALDVVRSKNERNYEGRRLLGERLNGAKSRFLP